MVITLPTSHRVSQRLLGDVTQGARDVHRQGLVDSWRVKRYAWFSAVNEPSGWESIGIDDSGWVGHDGGGSVLEYGRET